jgi:thiol-disulfide isomerase/thioredoxin
MTTARSSSALRARLASLQRRRWFRWGRDLALLAAIVLAVGAWQTRGHLGRGPAPELALTSLSGEPASLEPFRGRPVLLAVWAPWCPVCKANSGSLSWAARLAGDRAHVVNVAAAFDDAEQVRVHAREEGLLGPVLLAGDDAVRALRVASYPTYYFLDADGRVKRSAAGYTTTLGMLARLFL